MYFDNYTDVDVIIVARGGGSIEDLAPFNDEKLARIAYICNKPLISAVGHETDFSILDFVADLRAPTPSAAAELVTYDVKDMIKYVNDNLQAIEAATLNQFSMLENQNQMAILSIDKQINSLVNDEILHINDLLNDCDAAIDKTINNTTHRVDIVVNTLDKLNPAKLMSKGYSYVSVKNQPINNKNVKIGDELEIVATDVKLNAVVTKKEKIC